MVAAGTATFFDGMTATRRPVDVELGATTLRVRDADNQLLAEWRYDEIESRSAPEGMLRLGKTGNPILARLEVRDPRLATAIDELSTPIDRSGRVERRDRAKVIGWSIAATVSLMLVAVFGVPEIANRLAPLVPYSARAQVRGRARRAGSPHARYPPRGCRIRMRK